MKQLIKVRIENLTYFKIKNSYESFYEGEFGENQFLDETVIN